MNKAEPTDKLMQRTGLSARDARAAFVLFRSDPGQLRLIAAALVAGDKITLSAPDLRGEGRKARADAIPSRGRRSGSRDACARFQGRKAAQGNAEELTPAHLRGRREARDCIAEGAAAP